jgi:hypothetical protein
MPNPPLPYVESTCAGPSSVDKGGGAAAVHRATAARHTAARQHEKARRRRDTVVLYRRRTRDGNAFRAAPAGVGERAGRVLGLTTRALALRLLWTWRLNGLLLLVLSAVGLAVVVAVAVDSLRPRPDEPLTNVAGADLDQRDLRLGDFRAIAGTTLLHAELAAPAEYVGPGSKGYSGAVHNLLFFDTTTKKAHWLLPADDQLLRSTTFLMDPPSARWDTSGSSEDPKAVALAILLEVERPGDGPSTRSLAVAAPDGRGLATIAATSSGLLGHHQASKDVTFVFYVSDGSARVLDLDPITRTVRSDEVLSVDD